MSDTRVVDQDGSVSKQAETVSPANIHGVVDRELDRLFPERNVQRVLLVAPPDADATMFNYATGKRGRYWNFPPYGLGAIATHLRREEISTSVLNLNHVVLKACQSSHSESDFEFKACWKSALSNVLSEFRPDLVGLTCMFTQTHTSLVEVCEEIKRLAPDVPTAVGGVHITNNLIDPKTSDRLRSDLVAADLMFVYEAELAFKTFIKVVNRKISVESLAQVWFNTDKDLCFTKRVTPDAEDLDVIPSHDLMDTAELSQYGTIGSFGMLKDRGARLTTVLSNRGCRARCTFCSVRNFNGAGVRTRSIQSVIDEMIYLRDEFGIDHIMWLDDDFLYDSERCLRLFDEMVRQKVGVTWDCTNGVIAASCTDQLIAAAAESGCIGLNIGMESGNPLMLRQMKKPGTVETFLEAADVLRKYEQINSRVFLMIGFPNESYRMMLDTVNVATEMNLDWHNVTILQPLPNTPIYETMVNEGLLPEVDFTDVRYNAGPYGKHRKVAEKSRDLLASDFRAAFSDVDLDAVPPKEQLDEIWAYMNFHLNFRRLFDETRPKKLQQKLRYVSSITDRIAPENAFAMYFRGYLEQKIQGYVPIKTIEMAKERLRTSPYWQERFDDFGLSLDHLATGVFPDSESERGE